MKHRVLVAAIAAAVVTPTAMASGYKLNEQSAAGAGNAYAGRAAVVEDASIVFYNPAGMVKLKRPELTVGASYIDATGSFDLDSYTNGAGKTYNSLENSPYSDGGDFIPSAMVPYAYFAMPINEKFAAGFGVFAPFGTNTDYSDNFVGGGFADETQLTSIEFQPAVAYRLNDQISLGFGLDITYMKGLLSKQVDTIPYNEQLKLLNGGENPAHAGLGFTELTDPQWASNEGFNNHYEVSGDDWQLGYNLSMMWDINSDITLGVAYRSEMEFKLKGDSEFAQSTGVFGLTKAPTDIPSTSVEAGDYIIAPVDGVTGSVPKQGSEVPITTPQSLTVSYAQQLTSKLQLVAGATWTQWSVFKDFDVKSTESSPGMIEQLSDLEAGYIGHIEENWHDTVAVAIGANYQLNDDWLLRTGYANDQSPVSNSYRTARVPDNDREWLSAGFNYRINQDLDVDFAFSYLFFEDTKVNEYDREVDGSVKEGSSNLQGTYSMDALAYSLQVNYKL
ncbi:Protein involved in aromatic hydrocarbon degradation [Oleispira antarctica RB-8]|uniref:Protein involved in aromatic hydrocarbon degradation n=1 Tax=Oleispira antarctica RB-8 TaxID=698738 RepID=R4YTL1_OLEAN|nr:Protein involved in aromatic hydrocarbon degradation [Oleispira antarctica RB-8]